MLKNDMNKTSTSPSHRPTHLPLQLRPSVVLKTAWLLLLLLL